MKKNITQSELSEPINILSCVIKPFLAFLLFFFIFSFCIQKTEVVGASMENTLYDGDFLLTDKLIYLITGLDRFDIILFPAKDDDGEFIIFIKRIIALPGETVRIDEQGNIYINDKLLEENYGNEPIKYSGIAIDNFTLKDNEYFVLGDNRNDSRDSRMIGPVDKDIIIGRAFVKIYPFNKICFF